MPVVKDNEETLLQQDVPQDGGQESQDESEDSGSDSDDPEVPFEEAAARAELGRLRSDIATMSLKVSEQESMNIQLTRDNMRLDKIMQDFGFPSFRSEVDEEEYNLMGDEERRETRIKFLQEEVERVRNFNRILQAGNYSTMEEAVEQYKRIYGNPSAE